MKRYFRQLIYLILVGLLLSCEFSDQEEFEIGENFIDSNSGVVLIDTMQFYVSTVVADSFSTSTSTRLLIGGCQNIYSGKISSTPYFELASSSFSIVDNDLVFDSIVFVMNYDQYFYGDTTKILTFDIKQLGQTMELNDDDYLSSKASFATKPEPLGKLSFYPKPKENKEIMALVKHDFGKQLFDMIIAKNDTMTTDSYFKEFFKGVALVPETISGAMIGLSIASDSIGPCFRIYYHEEVAESENIEKTYFTIPYSLTGIHFNHFDRDFSGSQISGIEENKNELSSSVTGEKTVIHSGAGIFTKISIPGIQSLPGIAKKVAFISAKLSLIPLEGSFSDTNQLPDSLAIYIADRKNNITSQLKYSNGTSVYATKTNNGEFDNQLYYQADVTSFYSSLIAEVGYKEEFLFIGPTANSMVNSVQSVILGKSNKTAKPVDIEVYCFIDKN